MMIGEHVLDAQAMLPYGRQSIDDDDIAAVVAVLRSAFLTTGPTVPHFEQALCAAVGARYSVAVNSGTSALHAAYFAAGLGVGDEIITSPLTFIATGNAALYCGAAVRLVDVDPDTGNLDPAQIEPAINDKTRFIVPVDFTGHPADYEPITALARKHGLSVIADAAHSLGATYRGQRVGGLADATITSFHPVKAITTAEGGAVLTNSEPLARRAMSFRSHGVIRSSAIEEAEGPWYYEMQDLGFNYRMSDVHAALGLSQLAKLERFVRRRREIASLYNELLADDPAIVRPTVRPNVDPSWHLYVVRLREAQPDRQTVFERLRRAGVGVQVHYVPIHYHPYYQRLGYRRGQFPKAEAFYSRSISLPMFPAMEDADVERVVNSLRQAVTGGR